MIRIGLLGASRIAIGAIIEPIANISEVELVAVAARSASRARDYAILHDIPHVEPDYSALLTNPSIQLIYNGLPPSEHRHWTIEALRAGKHVLCEKPIAMNAREAEEMVAVARASGGKLIEAFHYRFHPLFIRVVSLLEAGAIGDVERVDCHFNVPVPYSPTELRYRRDLGGGAMMDLGCYPVHWARSLTGGRPEVIAASAEWHGSGVDIAMSAELVFPNGVRALLACSMSEHLPDRLDAGLKVTGSKGVLVVENPLAPHIGHKLTLDAGGDFSSETLDGQSTYYHQLKHVVDVIENDAVPLTGGFDAIETMRVIDSIYRVASATRAPKL